MVGAVTAAWRGQQRRVVTGLPSLGTRDASEVLGPHDVALTIAVVRGPDGAYYVGQLTGFPFPVGGTRVWRAVPGSAPTVYAGGFTNIIDIAFDKRGRLIVLEIDSNSLLNRCQRR